MPKCKSWLFFFSVLGMNLFGCLFCEIDEDGDRICSRRNFDSLLWSLITVFQVITDKVAIFDNFST